MNEPIIIASNIYNTIMHTYDAPLLLQVHSFCSLLQEFIHAIFTPP